MIITYPNRKIPENKKELENFVMRRVMDFTEYYHISNLDNLNQDNIAEHI